ncbi:hypothetical protein EJ02DRAFT_202339 [Clathrospora elynae]|uniref:Uncharacterized protein n=1 Tax=Clathrospora elynae TaxID=706981 RepID=A0A6A5SP45_9PLEO|nr:hypothetical protein EJ02DRAFT_202339 [Clathrospora elynae]
MRMPTPSLHVDMHVWPMHPSYCNTLILHTSNHDDGANLMFSAFESSNFNEIRTWISTLKRYANCRQAGSVDACPPRGRRMLESTPWSRSSSFLAGYQLLKLGVFGCFGCSTTRIHRYSILESHLNPRHIKLNEQNGAMSSQYRRHPCLTTISLFVLLHRRETVGLDASLFLPATICPPTSWSVVCLSPRVLRYGHRVFLFEG